MRSRKFRLLVMVLSASIGALAGCSGEQAVETKPDESGIVTVTEENFSALLTVEDVEGVLIVTVPLQTEFRDVKKMVESVDPAQVVAMDSAYSLSFEAEGGFKGMTFAVFDWKSQAAAESHFERLTSETSGLSVMDSPIGAASADVRVDGQGIGSTVVFIKGDKAVSLHTSQGKGEQPLVSLEGLKGLARIVEKRLR